jgi:hypothetical protein
MKSCATLVFFFLGIFSRLNAQRDLFANVAASSGNSAALKLGADWEVFLERQQGFFKKKKRFPTAYVGVELGYGTYYNFLTPLTIAHVAPRFGVTYAFADLFGVYGHLSYGWASKSCVRTEAELGVRLGISSSLGIQAGYRLFNINTANSNFPNLNFNQGMGFAGLVFSPHSKKIQPIYRVKKKFFAYPYSLGLKLGLRKHSLLYDRTHLVWNLDASYRFQKSNRRAWDVGLEWITDPTYFYKPDGKPTELKYPQNSEVTLRAGNLILMGRMALRTDLGFYILRPITSLKPMFYQGIGLDYRLSQNWEFRTRFKTHFQRKFIFDSPDFVEMGVVLRIQ